MDLPDELLEALESETPALTTRQLRDATYDLSQRFRKQHGRSDRAVAVSQQDVASYATYRFPATYAAVRAALVELRARKPDWHPRSLLDIGAGPGTVAWAAIEVWPDIERITLLEVQSGMIDFGRRLASRHQSAAMRTADWRRADLTAGWDAEPHDLSVAAYVVGELPQGHRDSLVERVWDCTIGTAVVGEPGTPLGFSFMRDARKNMIESGGHVVAPCPHNSECPVAQNDWCHFAQRLARTRPHRAAKRADLPFEDEKYSYVAVSRTPGTPIGGRIIRHPQIRSGHVRLKVCTPEGLAEHVVSRRDRQAFHEARDARWGSVLPPPIEGTP